MRNVQSLEITAHSCIWIFFTFIDWEKFKLQAQFGFNSYEHCNFIANMECGTAGTGFCIGNANANLNNNREWSECFVCTNKQQAISPHSQNVCTVVYVWVCGYGVVVWKNRVKSKRHKPLPTPICSSHSCGVQEAHEKNRNSDQFGN